MAQRRGTARARRSRRQDGDLDFWTFCCINCMHVLQTLGLSVQGNEFAVADSYNNRLARLDLSESQVDDIDDGFTCTDPVCIPLAEPAGVHHDGETRLLVSDTNNHRLVIYDRHARTTKTSA